MAAFFNLAILFFPLILTHTCQEWFPPFAQKKFTHISLPTICTKKLHSFILTQFDEGSHLEFSHVRFNHFTQKTSLIHSDSTWWWQPSWIWPFWIQSFCTKKTSLIHSDSTWWWQPSWTLPCGIQTLPSWIQTPCYLFTDSFKNTLTPIWLWLKLIQSD